MNDNVKPLINPDLENKTAFTQRKEIFGIDAPIFIFSLFIAGFGAILMISYFGLLLGGFSGIVFILVTFIPLYLVHKEDPIAWVVYYRSFLSPTYWEPCVVRKNRKILLLDKKDNQIVVKSLIK